MHPTWRDIFILFLLALIIRTLAALPQQQPNYMDASYSYVNALNLAQGRGFTEDFIWNYLDNPDTPPHPSHLYWMPLTSILTWLGMLIGGTNYRAAQLFFVILSALLAPISYSVAHNLSGDCWLSWLAGLFAIFSGFYFRFWTAIDNFTPFAVAGSLALLFAWRGMISSQRSVVSSQKNHQLPITNYPISNLLRSPAPLLLCSGVFIGLAHLARADGPLLLISILLIFALRITHHALRPTSHVLRTTILLAFFLIIGYLLPMLPWFIRNWQVVGMPLPSAGSQTMWLTSYDGLFSYNRDLSAQTFFTQEFGAIIQGRWWAFTINLQTVFAAWGMIFLAPLALVGGWYLRHHLLIQLAGMYAFLLFMVMSVIFAFPGARGGLLHSGAAVLPFVYGAAVVGLRRTIEWAAARRRGWDMSLAQRVFGVGLVVMAIALSSFIYYQRVLKNNRWNNADRHYPAIAEWIINQDSGAMVMIGNPPAYRYHGGGLSIIVPNENLDVTLQAIQKYGVDYLVLDSNHPAPLTDLYDNPADQTSLTLVQTFAQGTGSEIYIFEVNKQFQDNK